MKQKLFLAVLATTVALPVVVAPAAEASTNTPTFSDVSKKHTYYKEITEMAELGVIKGSKGKFNPSALITRAQAATMMHRLIDAKKLPFDKGGIPKVTDVSPQNSNYNVIREMVSAGKMWVKDGKFNPSRPMTRGEMAQALHQTFILSELNFYEEPKKHPFTDVSQDLDYYVSYLYQTGITTGSGGKFNENQTVTRQQFAVFLYRAMKYYENKLAQQPKRDYVLETDSYEDAANIIRKWPIVKVSGGGGKILNKELWASDLTRKIIVHGIPELQKEIPDIVINGVAGDLIVKKSDWKKTYIGNVGQLNIIERQGEWAIQIDSSTDSSWEILKVILPYVLPNEDPQQIIQQVKNAEKNLDNFTGTDISLQAGSNIFIHKQFSVLSIWKSTN